MEPVPVSRADRRAVSVGVLAAMVLAGTAAASPADVEAPEHSEASEPRAAPARLRAPQPAHLVEPAVRVRAKPRPGARIVRTLRDLRRDFRVQVVQILGQTRGSDGEIWFRVALPGRPNGSSGFIPADRVDLRSPIPTRILIDRSDRRLEVRRKGRTIMRTTVAVGKPGAETPLGSFHVTASFRPTEPILGAHAIETSAYSRVTDWPQGGIVGIHGTPNPEQLGRAVSHGCVRLHNRDINRLKRLAPPGTPIRIVR